MAENENNRIERYLNKEFSAEEKRQFEVELRESAELREELKRSRIEREIIDLIIKKEYGQKITGWSQATLDKVWEEESQSGGRSWNYKWLITIFTTLLIIAGAYWFWPKPSSLDSPSQESIEKPTHVEQGSSPVVEEPPVEIIEENTGGTPQTQPSSETQSEEINYRPIASLESRLGDADSEDGLSFEIQSPNPEISLNELRRLRISGEMKAVLTPPAGRYLIEIFHARQGRPEQSLLSDVPLDFGEPEGAVAFAGERTIPFSNQLQLPVEKGIYYYILYQKEPRTPFYVGKFIVR